MDAYIYKKNVQNNTCADSDIYTNKYLQYDDNK